MLLRFSHHRKHLTTISESISLLGFSQIFTHREKTGIDSDQLVHISDKMLLASSNPKKRGGRKKFQETHHPIYRGVRRRNPNYWVSEPVPASSEAKDIQRAAAEAAGAFRPTENENAGERATHGTLELQENDASYMDEETLFGTPEYIKKYAHDDMEAVSNLSLWSF
ncbi:Dehydration-responsive element-binding factor 1 [Heracleum sosnowskyi]|uniref:Dehydration-responsive element-binding factor 1 n=1 Tax=Heracleum sosnowskyi TaxID=360622 RepID=A0AAD8MBF5_9APIA|nr:Dehydration-responsive element-binding factor 1 [Heracleum sosnowskyi]